MTLPKPVHQLLKVLEWVLFLLLIPLFFLLVSPLLPTKKYIASYAVVSGSMEPQIPIGTLALVQSIPTDQLGPGDVIAFPQPDTPERIILHRITESQQSGSIREFKTKGDNNNASDLWTVDAQKVKGKLFVTIPYLGYIILFAQKPQGFLVLIGLPAILMILLQLKTIKEGIEEEVERRTQLAVSKHHSSHTS